MTMKRCGTLAGHGNQFGTDTDLVAIALRVLWALDGVLAEAAVSTFDRLSSPERDALRSSLLSAHSLLEDLRSRGNESH